MVLARFCKENRINQVSIWGRFGEDQHQHQHQHQRRFGGHFEVDSEVSWRSLSVKSGVLEPMQSEVMEC